MSHREPTTAGDSGALQLQARDVVADLLTDDATDDDIATALRHDNPFVRAAVATLPTVTPEVLLQLCADSDDRVRCVVALQPLPTDDVWLTVAVDPSPRVRRALRVNKQPPAWLRTVLTVDNEQLARHTQSGLILTVLAHHRHRMVRQLVARNTCTPAAVLVDLTADQYRSVRIDAATNPSLQRTDQEVMLQRGGAVAEAIVADRETRDDLLTSENAATRRAVLRASMRRWPLTGEQERTSADDSDAHVRRMVAATTSDLELLDQLRQDPAVSVADTAGHRWMALMADTFAEPLWDLLP